MRDLSILFYTFHIITIKEDYFYEKTRLISAILVAVMIFLVCSTTALAYEETQTLKSSVNNDQSHNQTHQDFEEAEMIYLETVDDFLKGGFESLYVPENTKIITNVKSDDVLSAIKYSESFSIDGTISKAEQSMDINEYYDFSTSSRFDIAKWAKNAEIITEAEMIECYCDLFIDRNFENISCLTCVVAEIQDYQENNVVSSELGKKIEEVMTPPFQTSSSNSENTRSTPDYTTEATYSSANFTIHYDSSTDINSSTAALYANHLEQLRTTFYNTYNFRYPLLQNNESRYHVYLDPNSHPTQDAGGVTHACITLTNTAPSYIVIFNATSALSQLTGYLKNLLAHEYFHAIQFAYNKNTTWFQDACAAFVAAVVTNTTIGDANKIKDFFRTTTPMSDDTNRYGAAVFPATIYKDYGGMSTIRAIYEEFNEHAATIMPSKLREIITNGIQNRGYSGSFESAYLNMAIYGYKPRDVYIDIFGDPEVFNWDPDSNNNYGITTTNLEYMSSRVGFNDSTNYLTSKYYQITYPEELKGAIKITVEFEDDNGYLQTYASKNSAYSQHTNENTSLNSVTTSTDNVATATIPNIGKDTSDNQYTGFVISNLNASGTLSYWVTLEILLPSNSFIYSNSTRYKEFVTYINAGGYSEYDIYFPIAGNKIFQTFGSKDTKMFLYDSNDNLVASNDDSGYGTNALISYNVNARSRYKLRVQLYWSSQEGETKLTMLTAPAISSYEDLFEGVDNWVSYRASPQQYNVAISQMKVTTSRTFRFTTSCTYDAYMDTFMYIIDPRSTNRVTSGGSASVFDDNSAGNNQATITKTFDVNVPYMLIVCLKDPSSETGTTHIIVSKTEI